MQQAAAAGYRPDMRKHRLEMFERACEQGIATVHGDEFRWRDGYGPEDVDWSTPVARDFPTEDDVRHG
jgi:hypothetical protein